MKKNRLKEIKNNSKGNFFENAEDIRKSISKLRFDLHVGKTDAVKDIRKLRKELAVVLTLQNQYERRNK